MPLVRLDKILTDTGLCSRSQAREIIRRGRAAVNGTPCADPAAKFDPEAVSLTVDGEPIDGPGHIYIMLNKPAGVLTATRDPRKPTVVDAMPEEWKRRGLFPVGRLDKDTEGLLLLTNQGDLAHDLLSPKKHVDKEYGVRVEGRLTAADCAAVKAGLHLDDGLDCQPAELAILPNTDGREAHITIREGKFHQIKRMMAYLGKPVLYLERVRMGNLTLDSALPRGSWRFLTEDEVRGLEIAVGEAEKNRNFNKK